MAVRLVGTNIGVDGVDSMHDLVTNLLELEPEWLKVISAFYSPETLRLATRFVEAGASVELLLGTAGGNLTKDLLVATRRFAERSLVDVSFGFVEKGIFHPKVLIAGTRHGDLGIVGSANLTQGGLLNNLELGLVIDGASEPGVSLLGRLRLVFDSLFQRSTSLEEAFDSLYETALDEEPPPPLDPAQESGVLEDSSGTGQEEHGTLSNEPVRTLLIELSPADVTRRPWGDALGTNQLNLPSVLPDLISWIPWPAPPPAQNNLVLRGHFIGSEALLGRVAPITFGIWQRQVRDWGALESPRFTFYRELANLVAEDLGQPQVGAVLVVGFGTDDLHDVMVLQPVRAQALGLTPDPLSATGGHRDYEGLSWEVRDDVDWGEVVLALDEA